MKTKDSHDLWFILGIKILIAFFLGIFTLNALADALGNSYSWDIDHEMYFGTRLLDGELIYVKEFHDKLPLVQYLFGVPALLKSVRVWILGSIGLSVIAAIAMRNTLLVMFSADVGKTSDRLKSVIADCGASCYLFLVSTLPGSLSHINPVATSLSIFPIYFLMRSSMADRKIYSCLMYLIAAVFGASAISIRPYLAPAIVLLGIWIPLRSVLASILSRRQVENGLIIQPVSKRMWAISIARYCCVWITMLVVTGVLLNVAPYIYTNNFMHFVDGIMHNAQSLNPQAIESTIISQTRDFALIGGLVTTVTAIAIIAPITILARRFRRNPKDQACACNAFMIDVDIFFSGLVPLVLIECIILSRHFWAHYLQLFAPYVAFSFAFSILIISSLKLAYEGTISPAWLFVILLTAFIVVISNAEIGRALMNVARMNIPHSQESTLTDIKNVTLMRKELGANSDFLYVSHMYPHWILGEARHGFPHAANFRHIEGGWWDKLTRAKLIDFPYNKKQLCMKLKSNGPSIIFASGDSQVEQCLLSSGSSYEMLDLPIIRTPDLKVFARD